MHSLTVRPFFFIDLAYFCRKLFIMQLITSSIHFSTKGFTDIIDITEDVQEKVALTDFNDGNVQLFVVGSTAAITTIEYEPGLVKTDFPELFEKIAPYQYQYGHHNTWGDDNGASHLRASLVGSSLNVPFQNKKLIHGTWQQIVVMDFDTRPRDRKVIAHIYGK